MIIVNLKKQIQIIFNISYSISNGSILNQTIFITNAINNQLIGILTQFCINGSSAIINYSTNKPLPQNVCLYVLLNITPSIALKKIFICRTINNHSSSHDYDYKIGDDDDNNESVGLSPLFIIEQGIMSFFMMFIIHLIHANRKKHFVNRIKQFIHHKKLVARANNIDKINLEITNERNFITPSIEEQVLDATDLTTKHNDRKILNHNLIGINEFKSYKNTKINTFKIYYFYSCETRISFIRISVGFIGITLFSTIC